MPTARTLCIDLRWIDSSGVGMYIKGILPGLVEQFHDISIVGLGDRDRLGAFDWSRAPHVHLLDCRAPRYSVAEQVQLPRAIPAATDLFFSPYYTIPLLYRGPLAVTVHDMSHRVVPEIVSNWKKRNYAKLMFRAVRRRASVIFTVSQFTRAELLRLTSGPRDDNIVVTPPGISPEWHNRPAQGAGAEAPYFVCVGNIKPYKNVARLLDAFLKLQYRIPHRLIIIGQYEGLITGESPRFFERARAAGDRVQLTGFISHDELLSLVRGARALIMPSQYEGFGLPPLEAMAAGVPVTVARAASLPEVCGDAALYFDPLNEEDMANRMFDLACDPALCARLAERGLERSRIFTWDVCARTTAAALRRCLQGGLQGV